MAVKATDSVTIAVGVDVASVDTWYKLQPSTSAAPARPTTASPSGWSQTEPTYDGTSTNTLYTCQKTTLTDNSFYWGNVSKSSSYEAAKVAYNEAQAAKRVATNYFAKDSTGLMVADGDGTETPSTATTRNVFINSDSVEIRNGQESRASIGETVRLGKKYVQGATDNEAHAVLDYRSFALKTKGDSNFFIVGDKRDRDGYIVETFAANMQVTLSSIPGTIKSVKVGGTETINWYLHNDREIIFNFTPSGQIEVTYTTSETPYYLTFGIRNNYIRPGYGFVGALSSVFGLSCSARDYCTFAAGRGADALAEAACAFNSGVAKGKYSHAEGYGTANGDYSHAEGSGTTANDHYSHAEGYGTTTNDIYSHAEGYETTANSGASHAEGSGTTANGASSHAEGGGTTAGRYMDDQAAHAEGFFTKAYDIASHAQNIGTWANKTAQTTLGTYNVKDTASTTTHPGGNSSGISGITDDFGDYAVIVGNGTADNARSNALTVDWSGNVEAAGDITDGGGNVLADKADTADLATKANVSDLPATQSLVPIGTILDFAGENAPTGYLVCNGDAVPRSDYAALFAAIGTKWGAGDGSTTFNLPDFRGRTSIGAGTGTATDATAHALGSTGGTETHKLTGDQSGNPELTHSVTQPTFRLPAHAHNLPNSTIVYNADSTQRMATSGSGTKISVNTNVGLDTGGVNATTRPMCDPVQAAAVTKHSKAAASQAHPNMQPFATVTKIIRAI